MMTEQQVVVTSALVMIVGLVAFTIGMWVGHGKRDEAEEAELDRAVARHRHPPGGRHRQDADMPGLLLELPERAHDLPVTAWTAAMAEDMDRVGAYGPFPVSEEEYQLLTSPLLPAEFEQHAREAMAVANESQEPSETAWTAAMAADMNRFITEKISQTDETLKEITR